MWYSGRYCKNIPFCETVFFIIHEEKKISFRNVSDLFMRVTVRLFGLISRSVRKITCNYHELIQKCNPPFKTGRDFFRN